MMHSTEEKKERAVLIAVENEGSSDLDELSLLVDTAGAEEVGRIVQNREARHGGHYIGKGKLDEVLSLVKELGADVVIADDELTAVQQRRLAEYLGVKILDRTMVILDIFAQRALTQEGKAQVELAQCRYSLSHLTGLGVSLSRQAGTAARGGVGNRGPGEKKLELDRRHIRNRITQLGKELKEIRAARDLHRKKREKSGIPVIALVGYTNAGKSTLMNTLTGAGVLAEDKLFATLDTTTRKTVLPNGGAEVLFTDTVGFINKLPHNLIQAFRATLEELNHADILLHVVDNSSSKQRDQMEVVMDTLRILGCSDKSIITVLNKTDIAPFYGEATMEWVPISAKNGENIQALFEAVEKQLVLLHKRLEILLPYDMGSLLNLIHTTCKVLNSESREDGTYLEIYATPEVKSRVAKYVLS